MNGNEKRPESEIRISSDNKFLKWLDNFWYHYKWPTLGVIFVLIVVGVCTWQFFSKEDPDIIVVYAGSADLKDSEVTQIGEIFSTYLSKDNNNDGKKQILLKKYLIYSEEEILAEREASKNTENGGTETGYPYIDGNRNTTEHDNYYSYMGTGDASIYLLEPWLYEEFPKKQKMPLSAIFGEDIPKGAIDEYGIRLGDTDLYRHYPLLNENFSPDTILFMQVPLYSESILNKSKNEEKAKVEKSVFSALVNFISDKPIETQPPAALPEDTSKQGDDSEIVTVA